MQLVIDVDNIKCGGCAGSIRKGLSENPRVQSVEVDISTGRVSVEADGDIRADLVTRLGQLGFPERSSA
jgi:copper chaperone